MQQASISPLHAATWRSFMMLTKHSSTSHQPVQASGTATSALQTNVYSLKCILQFCSNWAVPRILIHQHQLELAFQLRLSLINSQWCTYIYLFPINGTWKGTIQATTVRQRGLCWFEVLRQWPWHKCSDALSGTSWVTKKGAAKSENTFMSATAEY